jgi:hypothetical protein
VSDKVVISPAEVTDDPPPEGFHNEKLDISRSRVIEGSSYRDCSTVCLMPIRTAQEHLHYKVADAYRSLMTPMNHPFYPMRLVQMEVADAYNQGIKAILEHEELRNFKFVLTFESDNVPPPDGLIKLVETMYAGPWAGVGGLYWTKGEGGMPMIYGDPKDPSINYRPQVPVPEQVQECRGIAMGFTLWDLKLFRDERLGPPWFHTIQEHKPWIGSRSGTQDLDWCGRAAALGYRFAVDNRVRVGHVQLKPTPTHPAGFVW